jgi:hypothetical protein
MPNVVESVPIISEEKIPEKSRNSNAHLMKNLFFVFNKAVFGIKQ